MPLKKIEISSQADLDAAAINKEGFPKIKNAVSRAKAYRIGKKEEAVDCGPACNVKGQEKLAQQLNKE